MNVSDLLLLAFLALHANSLWVRYAAGEAATAARYTAGRASHRRSLPGWTPRCVS